MKGPALGTGGEDITWPDLVAPRGRRVPSTQKVKPQTSNLVHGSNLRAPQEGLYLFPSFGCREQGAAYGCRPVGRPVE